MEILDGQITFLVGRDLTRIEIRDKSSDVVFCRIHLTAQQLASALARIGHTPCKLLVNDLHNVGKKHEHKTIEFKIPDYLLGDSNFTIDEDLLRAHAQSILDEEGEGFTCEGYFRSQSSFFTFENVRYARATCRRWV